MTWGETRTLTGASSFSAQLAVVAYIAVLVFNDAREAGDEEAAKKAVRLLGGLWQRIVETPSLLRQLTDHCRRRNGCGDTPENGGGKGRSKAVAMDWEVPDHWPGHG